MKVKLEKLYFGAVANKDGDSPIKTLTQLKLPVDKSFIMVKAIKKIQEEVMAFEKVKNDLVKQFGEEIEGGSFKVKEENIAKFNEEIKKLLEVEVELDLPELKMNDIAGQSISSSDLIALDFIIKE